VLSVGASLSITRFAASRVAAIITKAPHLNFLGFFVLLILQFGMLSWWSPNIIVFHSLISNIPLFQEIDFKIDFRHDVVDVDVGKIEFVNDTPTIIPSPSYPITHLTSPFSQIYDIFLIPEIFEMLPVRGITLQGFLHNFSWVVPLSFMQHLSGLTNLIPNLIRLLITVIFVSLFFLKSAERPIMTIWARVVESDKPVFTLVFGGTAALAKAIQEIVKIF
jgi:hypothetical protein